MKACFPQLGQKLMGAAIIIDSIKFRRKGKVFEGFTQEFVCFFGFILSIARELLILRR